MIRRDCLACPDRAAWRGLCRDCYADLRIRARYVRPGKTAVPLHLRPVRVYPDPALPEPTDAEPGTAAKVMVLIGRCERGEALHHANDRRMGEWREEVA